MSRPVIIHNMQLIYSQLLYYSTDNIDHNPDNNTDTVNNTYHNIDHNTDHNTDNITDTAQPPWDPDLYVSQDSLNLFE